MYVAVWIERGFDKQKNHIITRKISQLHKSISEAIAEFIIEIGDTYICSSMAIFWPVDARYAVWSKLDSTALELITNATKKAEEDRAPSGAIIVLDNNNKFVTRNEKEETEYLLSVPSVYHCQWATQLPKEDRSQQVINLISGAKMYDELVILNLSIPEIASTLREAIFSNTLTK